MDKALVVLGMAVMMIGIGFGISDFFDGEDTMFYQTSGIWVTGAIAFVLGMVLFTKKEDSLIR